ncbi:MAG: murein biosynthesis integral membrane protein MurJ [Synergistaceae bacterium]|nr:murein biosynthesis integral membrane protein MurJ [Synergistaceae bacterium]
MAEKSAPMPGMVNRAMRMMAGTLTSRVLGLLREVLTAACFGATRALDAYNVAYTLANLSRQLLAEGALSASFVPVFSRLIARDGPDGARALACQVMAVLLCASGAVVLLGILCSPALVRIIAPGFDPEAENLAVALTRALFPFLAIVSVGALAMGVLNSVGSFFVPAAAPAASNLTFIAILLMFGRGGSIWTMVAAVLAGGAANMAIQWTMACRMGYTLLPAMPDTKNPDLRRAAALFLPYAAGLSLNQVNPVVSRILGSFLGDGVISALNYGDRIIQLPLGLFVIAISQAVLPMMSRIDPDDGENFRLFARDALRFNLFIVLPSSVALILLARPITHLLLVRGAFGEWAWNATSGALACYAAGLPGMACNTVLTRAMYARGLPKAAVSVTLFTVCANLISGVILMRSFSYLGLAAGMAIAFTGASFFGALLLMRDMKRAMGLFEVRWFIRLVSSCALLALAVWGASRLLPYPVDAPFAARAGWAAANVTFGCAVYAAATRLLRCPEWTWIKDAVSAGAPPCMH